MTKSKTKPARLIVATIERDADMLYAVVIPSAARNLSKADRSHSVTRVS
jgi:hypothetical protein